MVMLEYRVDGSMDAGGSGGTYGAGGRACERVLDEYICRMRPGCGVCSFLALMLHVSSIMCVSWSLRAPFFRQQPARCTVPC